MLEHFWIFRWSLKWMWGRIEIGFETNKKTPHCWKAFSIYSIKYKNLIVHWTGLGNQDFGFWGISDNWSFVFILSSIKTLQIWNSVFGVFSLCCPSRSVIPSFEEVNRDWRVRKAWLPARDPSRVYLRGVLGIGGRKSMSWLCALFCCCYHL